MIVYKATNTLNGKVYIGQTIQTLDKRANQHYRDMRSIKKNTPFQDAIQKYGFGNFE